MIGSNMNNNCDAVNSNISASSSSNSLDKTIILELVKQATIALSTIQHVVSIVYKSEFINTSELNTTNILNNNFSSNSNNHHSTSNNNNGSAINSNNITKNNKEGNVGSEFVTTNQLKNINADITTHSYNHFGNEENNEEFTRPLANTCIAGNDVRGLVIDNTKEKLCNVAAAYKNEEEVGIGRIPVDRKSKLNNNYENNYYNNNNVNQTTNKKNNIISNNNTIVKPKKNRMEENNNYEYNYYNQAKSNTISNVNYNRQGQQSNKQNRINIINKQNTKMDESGNTKNKDQANVNVNNISKKRKREEEYHYRISKQTYLYCKYCDNYGHTKSHCKAMVLKAIDQLNEHDKQSKNTKIIRRNSDSCITYNQVGRIVSDTEEERIVSSTKGERIVYDKKEERIVSDTLEERITLNTQEEIVPEVQQQQQKQQLLLLSKSQKEQNEMFELFFSHTEVQKKKGGSDNNCEIISEEEKDVIINNSGLNTSSSSTTTKEELINTNKEVNTKVKDIITIEEEDKIKIKSGLKSTTPSTPSTTTNESAISSKSIKNEKEEIKTSGLNQTPSPTTVNKNINKNEELEDLQNNNYTNEEDLSDEEDTTWPGINMTTDQAETIVEKIEALFPDYRTKRWLHKTHVELKLIVTYNTKNNNTTYIINRDLAERLQLLFEMESLRC